MIVIIDCDCCLWLVVVVVADAWWLSLLIKQGQTLGRGITPETALGVVIGFVTSSCLSRTHPFGRHRLLATTSV